MKFHKIYSTKAIQLIAATNGRPVRKHLNGDALIKAIRADFKKIPDHRADNASISLDDTIMSAFAMFQLKDPSLLAFDKRRREKPENLHTVHGIVNIPCDTQMRYTVDPIELAQFRRPFCSVFRHLQRGKNLEAMTILDGHYLISGDGTEFYSSTKVWSPNCLTKTLSNGTEMYYQHMYAAAIVNPDQKVVVPLFPELIITQDGSDKNDCERNAARRFYEAFRREHPHLKVIVTEDGLSSNGPHIEDLKRLDLRFILGAKPGDHKFLYAKVDQAIEQGKATEFECFDPDDPDKLHHFRFVNQVPLNQSNKDLLVNFLEYWQVNKDNKVTKFSWVTDLTITQENAFEIMRAGRARWKIENETFNTLKNQGYNLGHNYGLGKKNLSAVFTILMMLAFLVDQAQQISCWLFQAAWQKAESKRELWEHVRSIFRLYRVDSIETIYRFIVDGPAGYIIQQTE